MSELWTIIELVPKWVLQFYNSPKPSYLPNTNFWLRPCPSSKRLYGVLFRYSLWQTYRYTDPHACTKHNHYVHSKK